MAFGLGKKKEVKKNETPNIPDGAVNKEGTDIWTFPENPDENSLCAVRSDFINLHTSEAGSGATIDEAIADLLNEEGQTVDTAEQDAAEHSQQGNSDDDYAGEPGTAQRGLKTHQRKQQDYDEKNTE